MDSLCGFCCQVNFASILTPRENNKETWEYTTTYRPELTKPCSDSLTQGWYPGKTIRSGPPEDYLPQIRTASYQDLSDSETSDDSEEEDDRNAEESDARPQESDLADGTIKLLSGAAIGAADSDSEDDSTVDREARAKHGEDSHVTNSGEVNEGVSEETDSESSVATWSGNSHYTELDRIDLKKQAEGNWNYRPGHLYYLGTIWDVRSRRKECQLCRRFWEEMRTDFKVKSYFMTKSRCILKLIDFKTHRKPRDVRSEVNVMQLLFIYGMKFDNPEGYNWICETPLTIQSKYTPPVDGNVLQENFNNENFGLARDCTNTCNFQLFKQWLQYCEHEHDHPVPHHSLEDIAFRLIDVQKKCLVWYVDLADEQPRYVALSYVWGQAEQLRLLDDNYEDMIVPGYFQEHNILLPATIRDAIQLVQQIGERYLWVDALCIMQDATWDKKAQIPRMHDIYGSAILTIVSASGDSVASGLPGVQPDSRNRSEELELDVDKTRIVVRDSAAFYGASGAIGLVEDYLKASNSKWTTRGWTYQEGMLSRRLLIFLRNQVYWECSCATWEEQTCWESTELEFQGLRSIKNVTPMDIWLDAFERRAHDITSPDEDENEYHIAVDQESYPRIVREYTERLLTSHKDVESAIKGILQSIKEKEQTTFFHALRTKYFGNDLLFNMTNVLPRRFVAVQKHPRRFPIWSWLAWCGRVNIANDARGNSWDAVTNLVPCHGVRCHVLRKYEDNKDETFLETINPAGGWRFQDDYVRRGEGIWDPTQFHISNDAPVPNRRGEISDNPSVTSSVEQESTEQANDEVETRDASLRILEQLGWRADSDRVNEPVESPLSNAEVRRGESLGLPVDVQNLDRKDIMSHPAFPILRVDFHIIFATFVSTVVLRTEWDHFNDVMSGFTMGGTKKTRGDSLWSNRGEPYKRSLYVVRDKPKSDEKHIISEKTHPTDIQHGDDEDGACPCCGKVEKRFELPPGKEQGAYVGHIPPLGKSWDRKEYLQVVPDGIYQLLFMNNNQLPMWGHLLVKDELDADGMPTGVLERVCGATGPTSIMRKGDQEKYGAKWKICVMG